MIVEFKLSEAALQWGIPAPASLGAAGYDLRACTQIDIVVQPNTQKTINTGVAIGLPDRSWVAYIFPRSGLAAKQSVTLQNCVGVIDSDYQGEIQVLLRNEGTEPLVISPGHRIAQMVFSRIEHPVVTNVREFTQGETQRGTDGLGSTGVETGMIFNAQTVYTEMV